MRQSAFLFCLASGALHQHAPRQLSEGAGQGRIKGESSHNTGLVTWQSVSTIGVDRMTQIAIHDRYVDNLDMTPLSMTPLSTLSEIGSLQQEVDAQRQKNESQQQEIESLNSQAKTQQQAIADLLKRVEALEPK